MSLLQNIKINKEAKRSKATVNVGGSFTLPSGVYKAIINYMYLHKRDDGSLIANVELTFPDNNDTKKDFTLYITDEEGNTFNDKGVELKDFSLFRDLVQSSTGIDIHEEELSTEPRILEVYDFDAKERVEKEIDCFNELENQHVSIALLHNIKNKNSFDEVSNKWEPTNEKTENNVIKFVFFDGGFIREELDNEAEEPEFQATWLNEWNDKSNDTYAPVKGSPISKEKTGKKSLTSTTSTKSKGKGTTTKRPLL